MNLQRNLTEIEEKISASRRAYNAAVTDYNNAVEMFPSSVVAGMTGHRVRKFFTAAEDEKAAPGAELR
jgi:LemA protein